MFTFQTPPFISRQVRGSEFPTIWCLGFPFCRNAEYPFVGEAERLMVTASVTAFCFFLLSFWRSSLTDNYSTK
ncbi:hypothetical protein OJAV_G00196140 [Oryzias javanicus]|uniref:Uncharacterized protein n=1 Tax=Oryzias javanicus TaxID=123683 RepID=A0A3S2P6I0_ORYJA|nr:hypothetical protein OJAV_G00196140 [Oryzias javanicus]